MTSLPAPADSTEAGLGHVSVTRVVTTCAALACLLAGGVLASRYPIYPTAVVAAFLLWSAASFRWPFAWLAAIPALLPICGLATWTGWFAFEELDLLILGAAAGGYARLAWTERSRGSAMRASKVSPSAVAVLLIILFALSSTVALYRGILDAGAFEFDWYGSYDSAMNSIRLWKSFGLALLLWPLLQSALRIDDLRTARMLGAGLALGLAAASLAAVWERAAFTDLLNFSSDYRTTALFWEMHVGGAAFDGFLALTVPFVVRELGRAGKPWKMAMALGLAILASYACLTTFSRDVYLAIPTGLAVLALLLAAQRRAVPSRAAAISVWRVAMLAAVATGAFFLVFHEGGYRALVAFLATIAVGLMLDGTQRPATPAQWAVVLGAGLFLGALGAVVATLLAKGPYVVFACVLAGSVGLLIWRSIRPDTGRAVACWAGFIWLSVAAAVVALHWGGVGALWGSGAALLGWLALVVGNSMSWKPWLATDLKSRPIWLAGAAVLAAGVAVFSGGAYMVERFSSSSSDLEARLQHWKDGVGLMSGADWWIGRGLGRFPASYFFNAPDRTFPGSYYFHRSDGEHFVSLAGPRYPISWGDLFRLAQRASISPGMHTAKFEVRTREDVLLHVELCEQHLLYNGACAISTVQVSASPKWQQLSQVMDGRQLSRGSWYAPRLAFFAFGVASSGRSLDIRDASLIGPDGRNLLVNGDFADGMARWIPISERLHLPWHIKNLALDVLFDQGFAGLLAFGLLFALALWRVALGAARRHPLAPFLAASLVGYAVVGIFDSLLDVPRVAFLFYLIVLTSLALPEDGRP